MKLPKRAKLITDNGFSLMIDHPDRKTLVINLPLMKTIRYSAPELIDFDRELIVDIEFMFEKAYKNYSIYRQTGTVKII